MTILLKITTGSKVDFVEVNSTPIILGRSRSCSFEVQDPECSSQHIEVQVQNQVTTIKDLESRNGTFVNGVPQKQTNIYLGDKIRIGKTTLSLDDTQMTEEEKVLHTLNVQRKQTQMIKLDLKEDQISEIHRETPKEKIAKKAVRHSAQKIAQEKNKQENKSILEKILSLFSK